MLFGKLFTNPKMWVNGDANEITMGGVYTCKDVQNVPTGDGALLVFKTENTVKQVFIPVGEEGVVYTRVLGEEWASVTGTSEETEALIQSAIDKANQAQNKADLVDTKLNNIIVESGTSDAEVVAARTDSNGQTFTTLGERLDTQFGEIKNAVNIYGAYQMTYDKTLPLIWYSGRLGGAGQDPSFNATALKSAYTDFIPVTAGMKIKYKKTSPVNVVRAYEYDATKTYIRYTNLRAANTEYTIGDNASYIRIGYLWDVGTEAPVITPQYAYDTFHAEVETLMDDALRLNLHTVPKNVGVLNAIKRARQMTDIKWNIALDIDRVNSISGQHYSDPHLYFRNKFVTNEEYTGLPYSQKNLIGTRKGITQFITAANNAKTKECTDSGYTGDNNTASYFGTVCVSLVSYALHIPTINSTNYINAVGLTKQYDILTDGEYHDINDLELCDVLWARSHVAIITDITRNIAGEVTSIEVSESTKFGAYTKENSGAYGGICRRKTWYKNEFLEWFSSFGVYRMNNELLSKIPYVPNRFVTFDDSLPDNPKLPCITDEGDYANFYLSTPSQRSVNIIITNPELYTHLQVQKNGIDYALLEVEGDTLTVECDADSEGIYSAYLCTMRSGEKYYTSKPCHWVELGPTLSPTIKSNTDGSYTVSVIRGTDVGYPMAIAYNGTNDALYSGQYSIITAYTKAKVTRGYRYTMTVIPPSSVTNITSYSIVFDCKEYGQFQTQVLIPSSI